jgi:hypothetical protein
MTPLGRRKKDRQVKSSSGQNEAKLGFEEKLWAEADKLRGPMDAADKDQNIPRYNGDLGRDRQRCQRSTFSEANGSNPRSLTASFVKR